MNAAYKAERNAQFCYPGTNYIGHGGELHSFPFDEQGRDISWYEKNNFGNSKSYHVLGQYNDFYGIIGMMMISVLFIMLTMTRN